jgi:large subunit ribosomal protein L15
MKLGKEGSRTVRMHEFPASMDRKRRRRGRGESSGLGKTAGRGSKGARSRSGYSASPVTSGIPWYRKLPMRGFSRAQFEQRQAQVTLRRLLAVLDEKAGEVNAEYLKSRGLLRSNVRAYKVIGDTPLPFAVSVQANAFSAGARRSIQSAGGAAVLITGVANGRTGALS